MSTSTSNPNIPNPEYESTQRKRSPPNTKTNTNTTETSSIKETAANLPPPRRSSPLRTVAPPLAHSRLSTLIYVLVLLTALLGAYYSYRLVQYKSAVGGWWSLALGRRPPQMQAHSGVYSNHENTHWNGWQRAGGKPAKANTGEGEGSVEAHIQGLASALGMPTNELASAIASAVRAYVPPASLSSVAAQETGEAVKVMLQEPGESERGGAKVGASATAASGTGTGPVKVVDTVMEAMVGMDEP